jgi:hypothetical protein
MELTFQMVMLLGCYNHYREKKGKVNRQGQFGHGSERKSKLKLST